MTSTSTPSCSSRSRDCDSAFVCATQYAQTSPRKPRSTTSMTFFLPRYCVRSTSLPSTPFIVLNGSCLPYHSVRSPWPDARGGAPAARYESNMDAPPGFGPLTYSSTVASIRWRCATVRFGCGDAGTRAGSASILATTDSTIGDGAASSSLFFATATARSTGCVSAAISACASTPGAAGGLPGSSTPDASTLPLSSRASNTPLAAVPVSVQQNASLPAPLELV